MNSIGGFFFGLIWSIFTTFLLFSLFVWISFKISKIQKSLGEPEVLIFLFLSTLFSIGIEIFANIVHISVVFYRIADLIIIGFLTYLMSTGYWHLEKSVARKFTIIFVILLALIIVYSIIGNIIVTNTYNRLNTP